LLSFFGKQSDFLSLKYWSEAIFYYRNVCKELPAGFGFWDNSDFWFSGISFFGIAINSKIAL